MLSKIVKISRPFLGCSTTSLLQLSQTQKNLNYQLLFFKNFSTQSNDQQNKRKVKAEEENQEFTKTKEKLKFIGLIWKGFCYGTLAIFVYNYILLKNSKNPKDAIGAVVPFQNIASQIENKCVGAYHFFTRPPIEHLLPDIPQFPGFVHPKTLVLHLSGTVIHSHYVMGKGLCIKLRPGLQKLLQSLAHKYEIVIYTTDDSVFTESILEKIDPQRRVFAGAFGKESTVFHNGVNVKDLKYLNRDLKNIVVLEKDPKNIPLHKENGIFLEEFKGDQEDKGLLEIIAFLEYLSRPEIKDVRNEIKKFGAHNTAQAFIKHVQQRKEQFRSRQGFGGLFPGSQQNSSVQSQMNKK